MNSSFVGIVKKAGFPWRAANIPAANAFEDLAQAPAQAMLIVETDINSQKLQMLRTVSVQGIGPNIQSTKAGRHLAGLS